MASLLSVISKDRANEILVEASALLVKYPKLRLGQVIVNYMTLDESSMFTSELFYEECPRKALGLFCSKVEDENLDLVDWT